MHGQNNIKLLSYKSKVNKAILRVYTCLLAIFLDRSSCTNFPFSGRLLSAVHRRTNRHNDP